MSWRTAYLTLPWCCFNTQITMVQTSRMPSHPQRPVNVMLLSSWLHCPRKAKCRQSFAVAILKAACFLILSFSPSSSLSPCLLFVSSFSVFVYFYFACHFKIRLHIGDILLFFNWNEISTFRHSQNIKKFLR